MALFDFLTPFWGGKHVSATAAEIVHRCQDQVWNQVAVRVMSMGEAEAKGYTRARATPVIAPLVDEAIQNRPSLGEWARSQMMDEVARGLSYVVWYRVKRARKATEQPVRRAA